MPSGPLFIAKTVCFLPVQKAPLDLTFTSYSLFDTQNCSAVSQFLWASGRTVRVHPSPSPWTYLDPPVNILSLGS